MNCVKLTFSLYNLIFLLVGTGLLGFGLWFRFDKNAGNELINVIEETTQNDTNDDLIKLVHSSAYVLIGFGGFLFLLSLLGYCGAVKESRFLLGFYTLLLGLIVILQIIATVLIFYNLPEAKDRTESFLKEQLVERYQNSNDPKFTQSMDTLMKEYHCCGITNGTDFALSKYTNGKIPKTCCVKDYENTCTDGPTESNSYYHTGCFEKILDSIMSESGKKWGISAGVIIGILELAGILFACCLYREAKYQFN